MRRCPAPGYQSHPPLWGVRCLRTSHRSRPRAVKQLNNTELLDLVRISKKDTSCSPDNPIKEIVESHHDSLICSPLTEDRLVAARARYREGKPPPFKERSPFQSKLERNPYARILSTPLRLCLLTGVRLPSHLLIPFGIAKHPMTGAPWHLPRLSSLISDSHENAVTQSHSDRPTRNTSGTYFVASRGAFAYISELSKAAYLRLTPYRWKEDPGLKVTDIVWRKDMADFILENLRKSAVRDLKYLSSRPAAYIAACSSHDSIAAHGQVAAVLWLGHDFTPSARVTPSHSMTNAENDGPPPYAMHHYKSGYVPYYNLVSLLGLTHLRTLQESNSNHYGSQIAVIKAKRATVNVQIQLWKLLGFLSEAAGDDLTRADTSPQ